MDAGARGWLVAFARANAWKVAPHLGLDDLVQEGFLVSCKLRARYPNTNAAQHMALLKVSFPRHLIDLQRQCNTLQSVRLAGDLNISLERLAGAEDDLAQVWAELPTDIQGIAFAEDAPRTKPGRALAQAIEAHARIRLTEQARV